MKSLLRFFGCLILVRAATKIATFSAKFATMFKSVRRGCDSPLRWWLANVASKLEVSNAGQSQRQRQRHRVDARTQQRGVNYSSVVCVSLCTLLRFGSIAGEPLTRSLLAQIQSGAKNSDVVTLIPANEFKGHSADIYLGAMPLLKTIGANAFSEMKGILSIRFGDLKLLTSIADNAFHGVSNSKSIISIGAMPLLKTVGNRAFFNCRAKLNIEAGDCNHLTTFHDSSFERLHGRGSSLTFGAMPQLTDIGVSAFDTILGRDAELMLDFSKSTKLTKLTARAFLYSGSSTSTLLFGPMPKLKTVENSFALNWRGKMILNAGDCNHLTTIDDYAFKDDEDVGSNESVISFGKLPLLTKIGREAFLNYRGTLTIGAGDTKQLEQIGDQAFYGNAASSIALSSLFALKTIGTVGSGYFGSGSLSGPFHSYTGRCTNPMGADGATVYGNGDIPLTRSLVTAVARGVGDVSAVTCIPSFEFQSFNENIALGAMPLLKTIPPGAFMGMSGDLAFIGDDFPSIATIEDSAFKDMSGNLTLDAAQFKSLAVIESNAFMGVSGILTFTGEDFKQLTKIGGNAFKDVSHPLSSVTFKNLRGLDTVAGGTSFDGFAGAVSFAGPFERLSVPCTNLGKVGVTIVRSGEVPLTHALATAVEDNAAGATVADVTCVPAFEFLGFPSALSLGAMPQLKTIGDSAFHKAAGQIRIHFGDLKLLTSIADNAFNEVSNSKSIISIGAMPLLKTVGNRAFYKYTAKLNIDAGDCNHLTTFHDSSFQAFNNNDAYNNFRPGLSKGGSSLTFGAMPQLTDIGVFAFDGIHSDVELMLDFSKSAELTKLTARAFYNSGSLTSTLLFGPMPKLKIVEFYFVNTWRGKVILNAGDCNHLTRIDDVAFKNVGSNESVISFGKLPMLTKIGRGAFLNYKGTLTIDAGDTKQLEQIGDQAFYNADVADSQTASSVSLSHLNNLKSLGKSMFYNYRGTFALNFDRKTTALSSQLQSVAANAFAGVPNRDSTITIPRAGTVPILEAVLEQEDTFEGELIYFYVTTSTTTTTTTTTIGAGEVCDVATSGSIHTIRNPAVLPKYTAEVEECTTGSLCRYHCCSLLLGVDDTCAACTIEGACLPRLVFTPPSPPVDKPSSIHSINLDGWPAVMTNSKTEAVLPPCQSITGGNRTLQRGSEYIRWPSKETAPGVGPVMKYALRWGRPSADTVPSSHYVGTAPPFGLVESNQGKDPGLINVDRDTGEIVAVPAETGNYTLWYIAYEADPASKFGEAVDRDNIPHEFDQVVLAVWEFDVIEKPTFELALVDANDAEHARTYPANSSKAAYTTPPTDDPDAVYYVGDSYKFAPRSIAGTTNVSAGDLDDITYTLSADAPLSMFVQASNGVIFGQFEQPKKYDFQLIAVDKGGVRQVVETFSFPGVVERETFKVPDEGWRWNTTARLGIDDASAFTDGTVPDKIYGVGGTYRFAPITISRASGEHTGDGFKNVTFTIEGAPNGMLIDPADGFIEGTLAPVEKVSMMHVYAVDGVGARSLLTTIALDARKGPNGTHCENGGEIVELETTDSNFATSFACDCSATAYEGANCGIDTDKQAALKAKLDAETNAAESRRDAASAKKAGKQTSQIAGAAAGGIIALVLLAIAAKTYYNYWLTMQPLDWDKEFARMVASGEITPAGDETKRLVTPREVSRRNLNLIEKVGSGQFGDVFKAMLDEQFSRGTPEYMVAAKTVKDVANSPEGARELVAEAAVMMQVIGHPNLVSIIGVVTAGDPLVLVLQYCEHGSVLGYLKQKFAAGKAVSVGDKMVMASEIAAGMAHLAQKHFIHRDLAARNVLLAAGKSASGVVCKVADFGLSRGANNDEESTNEDYYKSSSGVFPVRWTSPEAMETLKFSPASDVWSFGIVVVELYQDGETPYRGKPNPDVMTLTMSGGRHEQPNDCGDAVYSVLLKCWDADPASRPSFGELKDTFSTFSAPKVQPRIDHILGKRTTTEFVSAGNEYNGFGFEDGEMPVDLGIQAHRASQGSVASYLMPDGMADQRKTSQASLVTETYTQGGFAREGSIHHNPSTAWEQSVDTLEGMTL